MGKISYELLDDAIKDNDVGFLEKYLEDSKADIQDFTHYITRYNEKKLKEEKFSKNLLEDNQVDLKNVIRYTKKSNKNKLTEKILVEFIKNTDIDLSKYTILNDLIMLKSEEIFEALIVKDIIKEVNVNIFRSIFKQQFDEAVQLILSTDKSIINSFSRLLFDEAIKQGSSKVVQALANKGLNIAPNYIELALSQENKNIEVIKLLIEKVETAYLKMSYCKVQSILKIAINNDCNEAVEALIIKGIKVEYSNIKQAVKEKKAEIAITLIRNVDFNLFDDFQQSTIIEQVIKNELKSILKILVNEKGVNLSPELNNILEGKFGVDWNNAEEASGDESIKVDDILTGMYPDDSAKIIVEGMGENSLDTESDFA